MRYLFGVIAGALVGGLATILLLVFNPLFDGDAPGGGSAADLPLAVSGQDTVDVLQSGSGYPWLPAQPATVAEPAIAGTRSAVQVLLAAAGQPDRVAYVARISTLTREGRPLLGEIIEQSLWHVVVPGGGSFIVAANDDLWGFARRMVLPLARGSDFSGKVAFETTVGPERGHARVIGLSGDYAGRTGTAELTQVLRRLSLGEGVTDAEAVLRVTF